MTRLAWLLLALAPLAAADERILAFDSDIRIFEDGWIEVTEEITVRAEGKRIRRGIYRDFPTRYRDVYGNVHEVAYEPLSVLRNGAPEDFHSEGRSNGIRTYFGSADRSLEPGVHTYRFRYRANRMLGHFDEYDELYWNVTGLEWAFPIDRASATVGFAFDAPPIREAAAYTGPMGARGSAYRQRIGDGYAYFETTGTLVPHEGLTVVVAWPDGYVEEPDALTRAVWLLRDNVNLIIALAGLAGMLAYFIPVWRAFGRDPEPGLVVTRYEPPEGFSPASLRYIQEMRYDNKVMTAAVVNLAVKGYLRIDEDDGDYTLVRTPGTGKPAPLSTGEQELLAALFEDGDSVELDDANHERIGGARKAHRDSLRRDYRGRYFRVNGIMNLPPFLIGVATGIVALTYGYGPTPAVIAVIVITALVYVLFAALMKRPTPLGRRLLDELAGFREYLDIAEKDEMNLRNPPKKTPELFERYLPFALAMGIEQHWAERFADVFDTLRAPGGEGYRPAWYGGRRDGFDPHTATAGLSGSLTSAISSSATPPGSSSGSGGGGFSGGGGGGGGGGGW